MTVDVDPSIGVTMVPIVGGRERVGKVRVRPPPTPLLLAPTRLLLAHLTCRGRRSKRPVSIVHDFFAVTRGQRRRKVVHCH